MWSVLMPHCVFLRQDIDMAVERSRKARTRAALHRRNDTAEAIINGEASVDTLMSQINEFNGVDESQAKPLSLRERRPLARGFNSKTFRSALGRYRRSNKVTEEAYCPERQYIVLIL